MRSAKFILSLLLLSTQAIFAQDWKTLYDQGKQAYNAEHYEEALASTEKAYDLAKKADVKSSAYSLQLLTAICLDGGFYDKGLSWSGEEIKKFSELEGENSKHYYEASRKQVKMLEQTGQLPAAAEKSAKLNELATKIFGIESYEYYTALFGYGEILTQLNSWSLAREVWSKCLPKLKQFPGASEDYFYGLHYAAFVDSKLGAAQDATKKWTEFVSIADQNNLQSIDEYKQAKAFLGGAPAKSSANVATPSGNIEPLQKQLAIALDYQNKKQWDLAAKEYAQLEKNISPDNAFTNTVFSHYLNYGRLLYQQNKVPEAKVKLGEAKKIAEKLFKTDAAEYGHLQYLEAEITLAEDHPAEAQSLYVNALTNLKAASPEIQATYLINASRLMLTVNQPQYATALLAPYAKTNGIPGANDKHHIDFITTYSDAQGAANKNDEAVSYLNQAINSVDTPSKIILQIKQAEALKESGHWQEAVSVLQAVLKSSTLTTENRAEASYQLARTQQQLGQHVASESSYLAAMELYRQTPSENIWQVSNSLATFYTQLGNYEAAESIYNKALSSLPANSTFRNTLKQNLAAIYQQTKKLKEAQQLLDEVVRSEKTSGNSMSAEYAVTLQNLAALHQKLGDYEKAKTLYTEALEIDKKYFGEESVNYATKLANLATTYEESGELNKARSLFETALKIRERKLGTVHPDYAFNEYNLAVLYHRMNEYALAKPLYKKVALFYMQQIRELFPALSEQEKAAFYNKIQEIITAYQDFAVDYARIDKNILSELLDFRLQTKALLLNSSMAIRTRILNSGDPVLIEKFANWLSMKEQLALLFSLPAEERAARKTSADDLQQKANAIEKELSTKSEFFASATEKTPPSWSGIQAVLKPGEAAIEMIRLRLNLKNDSVIYVALLVKPGMQIPEMIILPQGRAMEKREFSYYRNTIRYLYPNERSYQTYWKLLEPHLVNVNTVYFSPDGVYNKVNALTLFDAVKKEYLIDRLSVKLVSNLRDLLVKSVPGNSLPQAALIGFPDYLQNAPANHTNLTSTNQKSSAAFELVRGGIAPLPGTKVEVQKIEKLLKDNQWSVHSYLFETATEEIIKSQRSPALLHIATHGFFIDTPAKDGSLVYSQSILQADNNPLLRSGLMLAGAEKNLVNQLMGQTRNSTFEDGMLTAYEAMNMNLQNTDLVVLSACETGAGEVRNGEGVYGLQRSFLVAGANSLMMSLWKVNDEATQELMSLFYSNWITLKDKRKAFHQTQLELKRKYTEPFYWGAFVMIGQ